MELGVAEDIAEEERGRSSMLCEARQSTENIWAPATTLPRLNTAPSPRSPVLA